jgi:uncharacterized protein (DUF433 family)
MLLHARKKGALDPAGTVRHRSLAGFGSPVDPATAWTARLDRWFHFHLPVDSRHPERRLLGKTMNKPSTAKRKDTAKTSKKSAPSDVYERLSSDPKVCGGKICIKGTRIAVALVLELLASGMTTEEILAEYETLTKDDVLAALRYPAHLAHARIVAKAA